jgi:geranylgeranyl pyrophosphate synthase
MHAASRFSSRSPENSPDATPPLPIRMNATLQQRLAEGRSAVEAALDRICAHYVDPAPALVASPIRHALRAGGKRLRPVLCVAAWRATAGHAAAAPDALHDFAAALELIHTYSLMHDDLPCMDDDDLRRGQQTVHRVYGEAAAIRAGAALIPLAFRVLDDAGGAMGLASQQRLASIICLSCAAGGGGMVGGQWLDLQAEGRELTLEELGGVHAGKTGALFVAAARLGGIAAGASDAAIDALGRYGAALGLAFQIADDVLDETGVDAVLGKTAGRDRELDKATYPRLLGLAAARARADETARQAVAALRNGGIMSEELEALARFAVERDR